MPCTPGRNRITERGRSECERDPRTNLTVGRLPQQNISTGAPFWQNTQKERGRGAGGRRGVAAAAAKERGSTEKRGKDRGEGKKRAR